ncbi:hypothetical protein S83_045853 [Arachis hypogaea]
MCVSVYFGTSICVSVCIVLLQHLQNPFSNSTNGIFIKKTCLSDTHIHKQEAYVLPYNCAPFSLYSVFLLIWAICGEHMILLTGWSPKNVGRLFGIFHET